MIETTVTKTSVTETSVTETSVTESSAILFKQSLKQAQADTLYLSVLLNLGADLLAKGWQTETASNLLDNICKVTGAVNGFIAAQDKNILNVLAKKGLAYPVGARMPLVGNLAGLLKSPSQAQIITTPSPHCWPSTDANDCHNWLMPIVYQQNAYGVMGLHGKNLQHINMPSDLLLALSGLIGSLIYTNNQSVVTNIDQKQLNALTPREREIFALLPAGLTNQDLAVKLGIATGTIKIHIERILNKLNLKDRTQAAVKAVEMGYKSGI